jgi:predicted DNA-binding transcriptional regulator YafY
MRERHRTLQLSLRIARTLAASPVPLSVYDLAGACDVSSRTVWRHLLALQAVGIDVVASSAERSGQLSHLAPCRGKLTYWSLARTAWLAALDLPAETRRRA